MSLAGCYSLVLGIFGCELDAISSGGMKFCNSEFCLNFVFWSCHPVPVDPSGDCIRVVLGGAPVWCLFGMFWLLCVEHVWISNFSFDFASSSLICCSWGV